ncbi:pimeloyl-ACP methyl ester carboxylesterase [Roseovarius halotolerans]|uniref:Dihydrolipoyllysine-residue acetyltransferase component of acetoin cleaving system n=1 Tax=Roseovarius halotolerans TaxID=505353 RepID=A0A1X6YNN4_9RHOB|nr:alpha/beta hydrolase [Roseovarius halotolerans]RKT34213.1 pimeloyl-ACP methyl ester carboxylesterase [Roseovarius halotolerans]SLN25972.1 Dihydrolipoyllysine-residue acetyltransferase component of acetoin cleaving system [Roseovarius halotolerans]
MPLAVRIALALLLALALLWVVVQSRARTQEARAEAAFPPEGRILEVNGHRVHALSMGSGPDIVLIHGASGNLRDMTLSLAPRLAKRYRVTLLDRPGLGYTDRINRSGATIRQQAELLSDAARQIGVENPIVLGHSYGGAVALAWAVHRPDHIAALVPLSSPAKPWDSDLSAYYKLLSHPVLGPLVIPFLTAFVQDERVERAVESIFEPDPVPPGYIAHIGAPLTLRRNSLRANALQRAQLLDQITALQPALDALDLPIELVHGTADTTVGLHIHAEPLARQLDSASLTRLPGTGHMPQHADEDAVVAAIDRAAGRAGLHPAD